MTVQRVIAKLKEEKEKRVPARFHCRAIMVRTVEQYCRLLDELKKLGDISVISIDDLVSGADVMPDYERLTEKKYQNEWLILPGVSEYLRLFHANEERAQRFGLLWHHKWDASTTGRIIIPLWGCDTLWYDSALGLCDDERQSEDMFDCSGDNENQKIIIQVLSGEFEQYISQLQTNNGCISYGLKEWFSFWWNPKPDVQNHLILTKRYKNVKPTDGDICIQVVNDTLSFVAGNLVDGASLNPDICPKEAQACLLPYALKGKSIDNAILAELNAHTFSAIDVMGKWRTMSKGQKQLVFLWYSLHPDNSYLSFCVGKTKNIDDLPAQILTAIFPVHVSHPEWIQESQLLIAAASIEKTNEYYTQLDGMSTFEERLDYLTDCTVRERIYILHLVGQWMRKDIDAVLQSHKLRKTYPVLSAYLNECYPDESLNVYFSKYKTYKLSNTLPTDEDSYFSGLDSDSYEYRYPAIADEILDGETIILWIDALGAEWLPLLKWVLKTSDAGKVSSALVTQALLPSETKFNELWKQMDVPYKKYNKLDKLAHKGVIDDSDYYACIEEQFHFVSDIVSIVDDLIGQYSRILITGDHGTSRLAARFFHRRDAFPLPSHAEAGSHGRFCRVPDNQSPIMTNQKSVSDSEGNCYLIFSNYDHYPRSGFAGGADDDNPVFGEIHGGASPEEMLVPVITVNSRHAKPLTASWDMPGNSVKISNRRARCRIKFSKPVSAVQATIGNLSAECSSGIVPSKDWIVTFRGLKVSKPTQFVVSLAADGTLVSIEPIEVKSALGGDDPF